MAAKKQANTGPAEPVVRIRMLRNAVIGVGLTAAAGELVSVPQRAARTLVSMGRAAIHEGKRKSADAPAGAPAPADAGGDLSGDA